MLQFYYDCLLEFVDRKNFECLECDTDSLYIAISGKSLQEVIKEEKKEEFYKNYHQWFPAIACEQHRQEFISQKEDFKPKDCCLTQQKFDRRTPGLFKLEWEGDSFVGLCSKTYYCFGSSKKQVPKGISIAQNPFSEEHYMHVLQNQESGVGENVSFRVKNNRMFTYKQKRKALSYFYPKRKVASDGVSTLPLEI